MKNQQKIIRTKIGILELARQLGNVSQACAVNTVTGKRRCRRSQIQFRQPKKNFLAMTYLTDSRHEILHVSDHILAITFSIVL